MAKRKLTEVQRKSLRKEIGVRLSKKDAVADIVREISEKYKIASITARWYLKKVQDSRPGRKPGKGNGKSSVRANGIRKNGVRKVDGRTKAARLAKAARRKASRPRRTAGARSRVLSSVSKNGALEAAIAKSVQRTDLAKQLYPKLQATLNRARDLRRQEARTAKSARDTELRAKKLESQIRALTS